MAYEPELVRYKQLPISVFAGWDRVSQIDAVLQEHDYGMFRNSSLLVDAMGRDDRISGVISARVGGLLASERDIKPANGKAKAARIARELGGDDEMAGTFPEIASDQTIGALSEWGFSIGFTLGELVWTTTGGRWTPRLRVWHPQFVYWDWSAETFMLSTADGIVRLPRLEENNHSDGKWFMFAPKGFRYGWLRATVRSLAYKYIMRGWNYRDWARYNERHGLPILAGITPPGAEKRTKDQFFDYLRSLNTDGVAMFEQGEEGKKYDIKLVEAKSRGWETFQGFKSQLDTDIAVNVLGQNLTTEVKGGSRAAAEIQNQVRIDKRREDASIADAIRDQVLYWWALYNFGDPDLAPRISFQVDPPEDETEMATAAKGWGDAIQSLDVASDGRVDKYAMLETAGFPLLSEEEHQAVKEQRMEEQQQLLEQQQAQVTDGEEEGTDQTAAGGKGGKEPAAPAKTKATALSMGAPLKRYSFQGIPMAIENPQGSIRLWTDDEARNIGSTRMLHDYGYVEGVQGNDKEELDAYVGDDESAREVYVVHQLRAPDYRYYDEDKVFLGFPSADAAKAAFLAHRNDGEKAFKSMSVMKLEDFKAKLARRADGRSKATGKIRASVRADAVAAIMTLVQRSAWRAELRSTRPKYGKTRALRYVDRVESKAVQLAARALAPYVAGMREEIAAATDFKDLRERVIRRFRDARPEVLAEIVRKVNLLAHLSGRDTATLR